MHIVLLSFPMKMMRSSIKQDGPPIAARVVRHCHFCVMTQANNSIFATVVLANNVWQVANNVRLDENKH